MYLDPLTCIKTLCDALRNEYEAQRNAGNERKTSEDATGFSCEIPYVYAFLCPPDDRNKYNFPCKTPSVTCVLDSVSAQRSEYSCNGRFVYCCGNPSTSGAEMAIPTEGAETYHFDAESTEYTNEGAMRDLYEQCANGGYRLLQILNRMSFDGFRISALQLDLPDTRLPDFPFAQAQISFIIQSRTAETLAQGGWNMI